MYEQGVQAVEQDKRANSAGRHRSAKAMSGPIVLGLSVTALLVAFGAGAALLPTSVTGTGAAAERPAGQIGAPGPGADGAAGASSSPGAVPGSSPVPIRTLATSPKPKPSASRSPSAKPKPKPSPTRTATRPPTVSTGRNSQELEVSRLVNVARQKAGCGALTDNTKLHKAMRLHVEELGRHGDLYISHDSDDGRDFVDRAKEQGYNDAGGENVARGQWEPKDAMEGWMNSEGHRANILNCDYKSIGVGMAKGVDGTRVWGQIFGRS